jgi:uncharacterized protein (DUF2132 family)
VASVLLGKSALPVVIEPLRARQWQNHCMQDSDPLTAAPAAQPRNPLHGLTLEAIVTALAEYYGWEGLGQRIPVRCFTHDPSVASSLKFLRKTPWAREKVEGLYLFMLREVRRSQQGGR